MLTLRDKQPISAVSALIYCCVHYVLSQLQIRRFFQPKITDIFSYCSIKTYGVSTHYKRDASNE